MAALEGRPGAADSSDHVGSALSKIVRVLPATLAEEVAAVRQVPTAQTGTTGRPPDAEVTGALVRACEARRRVRIDHRRNETRSMDVDPWSVSLWRGHWSLLGWSHAAGGRAGGVLAAAPPRPAGPDRRRSHPG